MAQTDIPNALSKIAAREKNVPWYNPSLSHKLGDAARELLEKYSGIPAEEVEGHVYKIVRSVSYLQRDEAWDVFPYPCIGGFRFLDLALSQSPHYHTILQRLTPQHDSEDSQIFLDLGCCFGQELRKLAFDLSPYYSTQLYGADLRPEFFSLGYKLFRDEATLNATFITADIFAPLSSSPLGKLEGRVDVLYIGSFLHLFNWDKQVEVCTQIVKLSRDREGSVVLGRQVGNVESAEKVHRTNEGGSMFQHNVESFCRMWEEVGRKTGSRWRVEAELQVPDEMYVQEREKHHGVGTRRLVFSVWRE